MSIIAENRYIHSGCMKSNIKTSINKICLDDMIPGFKTLNVFGRTTLGRRIVRGDADATGSFIKLNTHDERTIKIDFELKCKNNHDFMRKCELLNHYLNTSGDVEIVFSDDKYTYYGQVTEVAKLEEMTNWVTSNFTITCKDYKKYGEILEIKDMHIFNYDYLYPIIPDKITVRCNTNSSRIRITNKTNEKMIELDGNFNQGDEIEIYPREQKIVKGSQNYLKYLNITSNLEDFEINYNDEIELEGCRIDIIFRSIRV